MRRIFLFLMVTAEGYFEGPAHELDWHRTDEEFAEYASRQLADADTLVFGARTYRLMADYWRTPAAMANDPTTARLMGSLTKIVFSRTLESVDWENTCLHRADVPGVLTAHRELPGKDIAVLGSAALSRTLLEHDLLDEVRLMVNPVLLGGGHSPLEGLQRRRSLELVDCRSFASGNVLLRYRTIPVS